MSRDISQDLHLSNIVCAHWVGYIGHVLPVSDVACALLKNDIFQCQATLAKACKHQKWCVRNDRRYWSLFAHIKYCM